MAYTCVRNTARAQCLAVRQLVRAHEVADIAALLQQRAGRPPVEAVCRLLWLLLNQKSLRYKPDPNVCGPPPSDLWRSPVATRDNGGGDCEDLSIFAMSMLVACGHWDVWLVIGDIWTRAGLKRHAWVEGIDPTGWYLLEATSGDLLRTTRPACYRADYAIGLASFTYLQNSAVG